MFIDANDCLKFGNFVTLIRFQVDMDDLFRHRMVKDGPPTFTKGLKVGQLQIDGCFTTSDIDCVGTWFFPSEMEFRTTEGSA